MWGIKNVKSEVEKLIVMGWGKTWPDRYFPGDRSDYSVSPPPPPHILFLNTSNIEYTVCRFDNT